MFCVDQLWIQFWVLLKKMVENPDEGQGEFSSSLTRNSRVRPMSRMDLTPAETTAMGVLPSSVRSALMSRAVRKIRIFNISPVIRSSALVSSLLTVLSISVNSPDASGDKHGDASSLSRDHSGGHRRTPGKALQNHRRAFESWHDWWK